MNAPEDSLGSVSPLTMSAARPLFPQKRKSIRDLAMSRKCQERSFGQPRRSVRLRCTISGSSELRMSLFQPRWRSASASKAKAGAVYRSHSTNVFLNHAQMDSESLQIDFEWACNLEQPHGRFNFGDSCLILDESASVCALRAFAFDVS